jgi:(p)ppGpp synthase/HD superfamily hydrolase
MSEVVAILKAAEAAARWHAAQRHKGIAEKPYINHLLEVARLVAEATNGSDTNLAIAAVLHDAVEDQEVPRDVIAAEFGDDVAALVDEVTDDPALDDAARKRAQVEHAPGLSRRAKLIKLADKTSNLRAVTAGTPPEWSVKRKLDYIAWQRQVVAGLRGADAWLEAEFDGAADAAERAVQP